VSEENGDRKRFWFKIEFFQAELKEMYVQLRVRKLLEIAVQGR